MIEDMLLLLNILWIFAVGFVIIRFLVPEKKKYNKSRIKKRPKK